MNKLKPSEQSTELIERAKNLDWKEGVYRGRIEPSYFATVKRYGDAAEFVAQDKLQFGDTWREVIDDETLANWEYVAPLPPAGYELKIFHDGEQFPADSFFLCFTKKGNEWLHASRHGTRAMTYEACGIEHDYIYAIPVQPNPTAADACGVEIVNVEVQS